MKTRKITKNGWKIINIQGTPRERGIQHGNILSKELSKIVSDFAIIVKESLDMTVTEFYSKCKIIYSIVEKQYPEFYQEICGISEGAKQKNVNISVEQLIAWNSILSVYSMPRCSAFIATGSATEKGDIVMAHNTHTDYVSGEFLNIVMYVQPSKGNSFIMQTAAGYICSLTDWFICSNGIIGCETTIGDTNYKVDFKNGTPYFCRIRTAMQYGNSLDDYVSIFSKKNAGDYACSWLLGNIHTNEIMLFELGLKLKNVERTKDGVFYGMNNPISPKLLEETENDVYDMFDKETSSGSRNIRLNYLLNIEYYQKINIHNAKKIISDHYDEYLEKQEKNEKGICNHDKMYGAIDGKVVNSSMARKMKFLGRFGFPCGTPFKPENKKKWKTVEKIPNHPWTKLYLTKKQKNINI